MLTVVRYFVYLIWGVLKCKLFTYMPELKPSPNLKEEPKDLLVLQLDLKHENHLKISLTLKRIMGTGQKSHARRCFGYSKQGQ